MERNLREAEYSVSEEPLQALFATEPEAWAGLRWPVPFVQPVWLKSWWDAFGSGWRPRVLSVRSGTRVIGIAPMRTRGPEARFLGDVNVCDYLDLVAEPGREPEFLAVLVDVLRREGVRRLDLRVLRPESTTVRFLQGAVEPLGCRADFRQEDVTYELDLPASWDAYLDGLDGHQRHEVRRKLRRFEEAGPFRLRVLTEPVTVRRGMETFLELFRSSRPEKAGFMDERMACFFRAMTAGMAAQGGVRLYILDLDRTVAAAVLCLESGRTTYLYNNGFDPRFESMSIGTISKLVTIRDCIDRGQGVYDFLKGAEPYKKHLGGRPVPLLRCRLDIP